jgi:tetratricopeptide (TPR) repeat protein
MSSLRGFKQKLSVVSRLWEEQDYDQALAEVESLLQTWPGNAHLHVLWASLVQLQEDPKHDLEEARQSLQQAVELDKGSPAAAIELGYFLDNVEDDPQAASRAYSAGVTAARQLLIEGLIGQAKAFRQLDKREEFLRCLVEVLHLTRFETSSKRNGPYAEQIQDLLNEPV